MYLPYHRHAISSTRENTYKSGECHHLSFVPKSTVERPGKNGCSFGTFKQRLEASKDTPRDDPLHSLSWSLSSSCRSSAVRSFIAMILHNQKTATCKREIVFSNEKIGFQSNFLITRSFPAGLPSYRIIHNIIAYNSVYSTIPYNESTGIFCGLWCQQESNNEQQAKPSRAVDNPMKVYHHTLQVVQDVSINSKFLKYIWNWREIIHNNTFSGLASEVVVAYLLTCLHPCVPFPSSLCGAFRYSIPRDFLKYWSLLPLLTFISKFYRASARFARMRAGSWKMDCSGWIDFIWTLQYDSIAHSYQYFYHFLWPEPASNSSWNWWYFTVNWKNLEKILKETFLCSS